MTALTASYPSTEGVFRYFDPASQASGEKPWSKVDADIGSFSQKSVNAKVYNARANSEDFRDVDRTGFAYHTYPSKVDGNAVLKNGPEVVSQYYPEIEQALRDKLVNGKDIKKVVIFDHTIRIKDPNAARQPVNQVHVDQTPKAAEVRVRRHSPEDADELLKKRWQLINVWRPLGHAASDTPLAVIDWRSAKREDLRAVDLLYPKREAEKDDGDDRFKEVRPDEASLRSTAGYEVKGETFNVSPNPDHRFHYVKDMTPDEIMFIKCFDSASQGLDSDKPGVAGFTPHTAFTDPNTAKDARPRQSIEVRCLVFYN